MFWYEKTLPTPLENLALDEALLEHAETASASHPTIQPAAWESLRFWEIPDTCVIMGRSSRFEAEVNSVSTKLDGVPSLRRASGGSTIVAGQGCMMYSLVLSYELRPHLRMLDEAHREVMSRLMESILSWVPDVKMEGTCDLTWKGKKFSGNALRCKRKFLLYHGTILYNFPLPHISRYLLEPPRQPDYRQKRPHSDFVTNVPIPPGDFQRSFAESWEASNGVPEVDPSLVQQLLQSRYLNPDWHRAYPCAIPSSSQDTSSSVQ